MIFLLAIPIYIPLMCVQLYPFLLNTYISIIIAILTNMGWYLIMPLIFISLISGVNSHTHIIHSYICLKVMSIQILCQILSCIIWDFDIVL